MGIADRYYHQMPPKVPRQPSRLDGSPVVKWLLISNIAIFFVDMFIGKWLTAYGHFSVALVFEHGQAWRFLSFQFLHAHLGHLFFNMWALYMFGAWVEKWWGSRKFAFFYLACGCSGAFLYALLYHAGLFGKEPIDVGMGMSLSAAYIPLVGASAGIYACLVAVAVIAPDLRVMLLFPPIPLKMKTLALVALGIAVLITLTNSNNAGGEAGHLGGAILGYLLMKNPQWLSFLGGGRSRGNGAYSGKRMYDAKEVRSATARKIRPRVTINLNDSEVDCILDKVNREGLQSLSEEERDILRRASGN